MNRSGKWLIIFLVIIMNIMQASLQECKATGKNNKEIKAVWLHQTKFDKDEATAKKQIAGLFDAYSQIGINSLYCY